MMDLNRVLDRTARDLNIGCAKPLYDVMPDHFRQFHGIERDIRPEKLYPDYEPISKIGKSYQEPDTSFDLYKTDRILKKTARELDIPCGKPLDDIMPRHYREFHGITTYPEMEEPKILPPYRDEIYEIEDPKPFKPYKDEFYSFEAKIPKNEDDYIDSILHPYKNNRKDEFLL
jgi:hypothetical protein